MSVIFLQGDAKEVLKGLPANFFHVCVTSPPFFGLRRYEGGEEIWDGGSECEHDWGGERAGRRIRTAHDIVDQASKEATKPASAFDATGGRFCSKCGAWRGQLGGEPTPDLYISHLIQIMREVRRVLRPDGVFWLNIGDSWAGSGGAHRPEHANPGMSKSASRGGVPLGGVSYDGVKPLDMVLIPSLLALAARADGWYVRSMVVWAKGVSGSSEYNGNPMPESVNGWRWERCSVKVKPSKRSDLGRQLADAYFTPQKQAGELWSTTSNAVWADCPGCSKCLPNDGYVLRKGSWRPTDSYEFVLMLTKTDSYYCDREAVLEPIAESTVGRGKVSFGGAKGRAYQPSKDDPNFRNGSEQWGRTYDYQESNRNGGRNLRSVLCVPTAPFKGAHFATYPPKLIETLIKSSTSEKGCCLKCGAPWARVLEKGLAAHDGGTDCAYPVGTTANRLALLRQAARERGGEYVNSSQTVGWRPTCSCGVDDSSPCRVLDPFSGAGTTALVAERLNLDSISVDTSAEYIQLSRDRLAGDEQKRIDEFIKQAKRASKGVVHK